MTTIANKAGNGVWAEGEKEWVLRELLQHLEPMPLLRRFAVLVGEMVPFVVLEFRHPLPEIACTIPLQQPPLSPVTASIHDIAHGSLCFLRRHAYREQERHKLADCIELLQLPLRNAIRYHQACMKSKSILPSVGSHGQGTKAKPVSPVRDSELSLALQNGQLTLHYQPKVEMKSGRVVGLEALLRWRHSRLGMLSPELFIPAAEQNGLIHPITHWVLQAAISQCARWREEGVVLPVAVNLSGLDLEDSNLPDYVAALLQRWQLPSRYIEVEITETADIADQRKCIDVLSNFSQLGIGVAIDDFGTGYSSLHRLRQLPVNTIKIDKSFITDSSEIEQDMVFVDSITRLGHRLGLKVVAEGVECQESWTRLAAAGCDIGQGYHISRPLPVEAVSGWLRAGKAGAIGMG